MATMSEVMRYALDLDVDGFLSGLRKAEKGADDTFDDIDDKGEDTAGRFDGLGGKMGKALVAGFAAVGVGALLMQGINQAMDAQEGVRRLQGQFDLTAQEAKRFGDLAGSLYRDGWGQSLEEVQQAFALTSQRLEIDNDAALSSITEGVLATTKTFGVEFDQVIRSVSQLLENDLAPDAEAALDLIVRAFQNGGDEAGDLLDTIDEYSQHWRAAGLSGEEALSQIIDGLQNGQRDADKMADAVKEMRIRVVENSDAVRDALTDIGVDADHVVEAFLEGGPAAREAFLEVIEALRDGQAAGDDTTNAVAILGTQFEDLGPKALDSLLAIEGKLGDVEGATQDLSDTVEATEWEKFKRRGETTLTGIGDMALRGANPMLEQMGRSVDALTSGFGLFGDSAVENLDQAVEALDNANRATFELTEAQREQYEEALRSAAAAEAEAKSALLASEAKRDQAKAANHIATVLGRATDETDDLAEATDDLTDELSEADIAFQRFMAQLDNKSAWRSAQDSVADYHQAIADADQALEDGTLTPEKYRAATERAFDDMIEDAARYVESLEGVPSELKTDFIAAVRQGDVERIEAELAELTRTREIILHYRTTGSQNAPTVTPNFGGPQHDGGIAGLPHTTTDEVLHVLQKGEGIIDRDTMRKGLPASNTGGSGVTFIANFHQPVYGVDDLEKRLNEWGQRQAAQIRAGRRIAP